ncbi:MAG: hypothetical protein J0M24_13390 [Verrucomicrobia bacterium]|nr:hypothetical protein [Verrucomicrobiota bacterium]
MQGTSRPRPLWIGLAGWILGCWLGWFAAWAGVAETLDAAWARLPEPVQHGPALAPDTEADRFAALIREKLTDRWFAALVSVEPESRNAILGRFTTRRGFFEFLESQNPLVELWAYVAGGPGEDGLPGRRLTAEEVARVTETSPGTPTFVTVTWADAENSGKVRRARVEFGFAAADQALVRGLAYQRSRLLQQTARQILSARDKSGRLSAEAQWRELEREKADGGFVLVTPEPLPASATNLYVAFEFTVDDDSNLLRPVMVYRQNDIEREVLDGQIRLRLRQPGGGIVTARAFRRTPLGDGLEPALSPISGRDFVELRLEDPLEPDPRRWNVLEFGEPDVLQQAALARFGLINAFLERRRKELGLQRANLDMIFFPIFTALNIGGGLSGVGFPLGTGAQLGYNVITGPHYIPKVPTAQEMRELFLLLAARQRHPILRFTPDEVLTKADLETLRAELSQLTDAEVEETLESLNDADLRAMLALARLAGNDAKYSLLVNILSGAAVVSGQADSGVLRDIFNNPYFALNGDVYVNYIIAAAVGQKVLTPAGGYSLYDLARGDGPAKAWAQYLGISFDIRALMNSVSRMRFRSLADKELRMPFPYAPRMNDLAAYEFRIFGYPILLFYKRGLIRDDLNAYNEDYAYGLLGRTIVTHFPTRESMEAEIRAGRMVPLGYVKVSDGKGGLRDSNLAVFAYQIPDGRHRGQTAMILYGLKAFAEYSATVDREVTRFREYERGLAEGLVLDQLVEAEDAADLPATAFEPRVFTGEGAIAEHFVPVLAPLVEWRRLLRRQQLGLPPEPGEAEHRDHLRRVLAAVDIVVDDSGEDPLLGIQAEGSSFRYVTRVNGQRRVRQLTAVAGLAAVERAGRQQEENRQIAEWHRAAIAEGGSGMAFLNQVEWRNGRWEVGPLVRSANGFVDGAGIRRTAEQLAPVWSAVEALPLRERVAARERNFAGLILELDADGDGTSERVAVSFEFPVGQVRRTRTNPETGLVEVEVYANGRLQHVVTATSWLEISRDDQGRETESHLWFNTGTLSEPMRGELLEQTRTLERWTPGAGWDPYAAREGKLRLNCVTGQWTWEIYGLFNRPVESADERAITRSQFDETGRWVSAVGWINTAPEEFGVLPPPAVLRPTPGERRFRETALGGVNGQRRVERVDDVTGVRRVLTFNAARWGRLETEEFLDPGGAGVPIRKRTESEYDEAFHFGWIPRVSRTRAESGRLWLEATTRSVDPIARRVTAEVRDETGARRIQTWSARWDVPLRSETQSRITEQQLAADGLSLTGSIRARDTGEEVARLVGRFDRSLRQWVMEWEWWYRPGIRQRQETRYLSPGGQELRTVSGGVLETRVFRDAEGFGRSNQVWFAEAPGGDFNRLVRAEDDWNWRDGSLETRVRTWVEGQAHDEFRVTRDPEGRLVRDGIRRWPLLQLETRVDYDGDSERVRRAEGIQNGQVRRMGRPLADQPGDGTERRLPLQFTPHWGLGTTQWMVLGDPLGRPRETVTEDGRRSVAVEWYSGTALARRTETRDRRGRLQEWSRWEPSTRVLRGIPVDRVRRSVPGATETVEVPLGDRWLARGTDIVVAEESAEGQVFTRLEEPGEFPEWTRDESGRSGVAVRLGEGWERNVVLVSRARMLSAEAPGEPLLELQTVDLRPLFQPMRTVQRLDRSGKVLEARVSRIAAPASGEFVAEALWNAPSSPGDQCLHRYEYAPAWQVARSQSQGRLAGAYETWTLQPPQTDEAAVPVNVPPWREVATSVESFLVLPEVSARPDGALRRVSRSEGRQLWRSNPYLREETSLWTSWSTRVLTPAGKELFTTEEIYDVQGQLSVRRIRKETLNGEPAVKWVYQLPAPRAEELAELTSSNGLWRAVLVWDSGWIPPKANFLYFFTEATNAVEPVIHLRGFRGEQVTVGGISGQSIAFWPISAAFTQWLPNEADPSQAATVTEPPTLPAGLRAYVINLAEVAQAGLDPMTINQVVLEAPGPLRVTPLKTLERDGTHEVPQKSRRLIRQREDSPHDFHRITQVPLQRSAAARYAGEDQQTVVERNGRPLAVTRPPLRRSPYPDVVVLATGDSGEPRPLYQVSSESGHFLQFFEVVRQPESVQVYSVVEGFELPRFEVHRSRVLGDEASPSLVAYGYDYHARVQLAKGAGWWGRPWAALRNRVAANPFSYAGERMLDRWRGTNGPLVSRFNYGTLHHARVQSAAIQQLPSLAEGLLPTRTVPWAGLSAEQVAPAPAIPINWSDVGFALRELHVSSFGTNLTRSLPGTYLIPTAPDTVAERYVETVAEAELIALALKVGEVGIARTLLEFYWDKTDGGLEPVQESYDALTGTARAKELAFSRPVQARPTSLAQVTLASAALDLADQTGETRWETLAHQLVEGMLERFRPPINGEIPRAVSDREYRSVKRVLGFAFWPDAARFPVEVNVRTWQLLERMNRRQVLMPDAERAGRLRTAAAEQRQWLTAVVEPEVRRTGVVPTGWFEVQDIYGETLSLAPERWTSPMAWLAWLEVAVPLGVEPAVARQWLDQLIRVHGATVEGIWGLDWSLPLLRSEAISPELTARMARVAGGLEHEAAAALARRSLAQWAEAGRFPAVHTRATPVRPVKTEQGPVVYPRVDGSGWPRSFGVERELSATNSPLSANSSPARLRPDRDAEERPSRADLAVFLILAGSFYVGILVVTLVWWRFRQLRCARLAGEELVSLVPDTVQQRAEERWSARVLGVQSPAQASCTRFSNATVEQNFLMQLRAIYKLVLEWRRRENRWSEDDARLVEGDSDAWLNGLDEFASVLGLYMRHVIKAGAKDGFDSELPLAGNEDSNHIWSRLVMYLSEEYWVLLTLLQKYRELPGDQECALFEWEFAKALGALGIRQRREPFDARVRFNFPQNPEAFDLLIIQKPGVTLEQVFQHAADRLQIPLTHLLRIVEGYQSWKRRECPYPIHPYLIEFAKIFPNFVLTGLGAMIWYNQSVGDSPIIPYLWPQAVSFVLSPAALWWEVPLFLGLVLAGVTAWVRTYRFAGGLLKRERPSLILDATMTSFFRRDDGGEHGIREGWRWNPTGYQQASWVLRSVGWTILAWQMFELETPSFANFLIVKGVLAMLVVTEVAGLVVPWVVTLFSKAVQDYVSSHPHCGTGWRLVNRLNLTATRPASPIWLSVRYYLRPSVPTGDVASRIQSILFYLVINVVFFGVGAYLCQQILPLWFTEAYLTGSSFKLFVGGLVFWNTLYLLRYGLFLLATAVAAGGATFPARTAAALVAVGGLAATVGVAGGRWLEWVGWLVVFLLIPFVLWEEAWRAAWARWRRSDRSVPQPTTPSPEGNLGIVYMSGDDLSALKLTPALLLTRWRLLRDQLGSSGLQLLSELIGDWSEADLERYFGELADLERRHAVSLWHPDQLVLAGTEPRFAPSLELNLPVDSAEQRRSLLLAWDVRRWLVSMMSTAGHSQDTAINLVDIALRLDREGLAARSVFYLIQNKYDAQDTNRPCQLKYGEGELGQRDKLARLLRAVAPGCRAWSLQNWTPFGFKSAGLTGMDLVPEEAMRLATMVVLDRNATVHDLDAFVVDLRSALADPDLVIVIPGRGTTNTLTDLGQGSQLIEEGHRSFLRGVMAFLGGRASEGVGTGWGNIVTVTYGRVQRAMMCPSTPKLPLTSRMLRGSSFAVRTEGLIGFTPHAVGISEDTWAVSQAAHNVAALGGRVRFAVSTAMWHKVRETWSHAEWLAAFPRWSGGYLQMMHDPIMQRINEFGPSSIFSKELRSNSGRNFLAAPFALINALLLPLAIILDVTPFIQILMLLWNFGFVMNQVLTLHGLNTYLEGAGFHRLPAALGTLVFGLGAAAFPESRPYAPWLALLGALYGGFVVGLNRWLVTRVRDVILFGPQLILHALGQLMRQSIEFVASGAAASDAQGVNMAFRSAAGPREDRPLDRFPHFLNLRTVIWIIGVPSLLLNLVALANLDMFNVLLLLPSLLFSVSAVAGPFLMAPRPGHNLGPAVIAPKLLGWMTALIFFGVVSLLVGRGGWGQTLGFGLFAGVFGFLAWRAGRYLAFRWLWKRRQLQLRRRLLQAGVPEAAVDRLRDELLSAAGDDSQAATILVRAVTEPAHRELVAVWLRRAVGEWLREPGRRPKDRSRSVIEYQRSVVLALLVFLWFFVVPVPGLFVFTAGAYKTSMSLAAILTGLSMVVIAVLAGHGVGRWVQILERSSRGNARLRPRARAVYAELQRRQGDGELSAEEISRALALFTDFKTYLDQRSDAYAERTLKQVEETVRGGPARAGEPG